MKKFFQNEEIGPTCDIRFNSTVVGVKRTDGLEVVSSSQPKEVYLVCTLIEFVMSKLKSLQVKKNDIVKYNTGKGKPPCMVMTLRAVSDEATPPDLQSTITLSGVEDDDVIKLSMIRKTQ